MAKPVPREVGLQVPRRDHTEVSRKVFYGKLRRQIGAILRELCRQEGSNCWKGMRCPTTSTCA